MVIMKEYYVYKLNCENGVYIGLTTDLKKRLANHMTGNRHSDHPFISHEIMVVCQTKALASYFEDVAIQKYGTLNEARSGYIAKDLVKYHQIKDKERYDLISEGEKMMFGKTNQKLYRNMFKGGRV